MSAPGSQPPPNPLPPRSPEEASTSVPAKPRRGRRPSTVDPTGPLVPLRRSKRHSTENSTPDGPLIKQEVDEVVAKPPAKKRRGRPSKSSQVPEVRVKEEIRAKDANPEGRILVNVEEPMRVAGPSWTTAAAGPSTPEGDVKPSIQELAAVAALARAQSQHAAHTLESLNPAPSSSMVRTNASPAKMPGKPSVSKAPTKEKIDKPAKPEKRAARIRANAPKSTMQRAQRVMTQRMYLVHREKYPGTTLAEQFKVLGSTGNVYTIKIDSTPSCNCPDCLKGNLPCKHIIFVFLKVLKVPTESPLWFQKSFLLSELEEVFSSAPTAPNENLVSVKVRNAYLKAMGLGGDGEAEKAEEVAAREAEEAAAQAARDGRKWTVGDDCPVCYDEMSEEDEQKGRLVFDEAENGCGKPLHADCFKMWATTARAKGDDVTCVWCRTPWPMADSAGVGKGKGKAAGGLDYSALGYLNMAELAGMSRQRDTSSYYQGPIAGRSWANRYADD